MKVSIQHEAAKHLVHKAIMSDTPTQAEILARAAATLNPSINPTKVQDIWLAKFKQTKNPAHNE